MGQIGRGNMQEMGIENMDTAVFVLEMGVY